METICPRCGACVDEGCRPNPHPQCPGEHQFDEALRTRDYMQGKLKELEAEASIMRGALMAVCAPCLSYEDRQVRNAQVSAALSGTAGRAILDELEALREVAESARNVPGVVGVLVQEARDGVRYEPTMKRALDNTMKLRAALQKLDAMRSKEET